MGYMHIDNLYNFEQMLMFKEVYALEKIHGKSAHIHINSEKCQVTYFSGENHDQLRGMFNDSDLLRNAEGMPDCYIYGEHHGGKILRQSARYGAEKRFVAFDVNINGMWLSVPKAVNVCHRFGIQFVYYKKIYNELNLLDIERDAPSVQAERNGVQESQMREGIVIRPMEEAFRNDGKRFIAKHKRPEFSETNTPRVVGEIPPERQRAEELAVEWVTHNRLLNILSHYDYRQVQDTPKIISLMIEDVLRESDGEVPDNKDNRKAIGAMAAKIFKQHLNAEARNAM